MSRLRKRAVAGRTQADDRRAAAPLGRRDLLGGAAGAAAAAMLAPFAFAQSPDAGGARPTRFLRISTQFIAALAAPDATAGDNAHEWGLWRLDPGPRGVRLDRYPHLKAAGGTAPAGWQFDDTAWWLEEHGLIMEPPEFPLAPGRYMVTGDRVATSALTVAPPGADGRQRWSLDDGPTIHDVTHLRCRSAVYTPAGGAGSCTPAEARQADFPVEPGAPMPPVPGCRKQDYQVLLVVGVAADSA